jgi:hypothetical protein
VEHEAGLESDIFEMVKYVVGIHGIFPQKYFLDLLMHRFAGLFLG